MSVTERARKIFPGGVNSPVRTFASVDLPPILPERGAGAHVFGTDGKKYIDLCLAFGPLILGHAHPRVVEAVQQTMAGGSTFGLTSEPEVVLGEMITGSISGVEKLRFVNSGTEACMTAIRLARAFTGRAKVLKCTGCYHGHVDGLLVQAGSGVAGIATASSAGVPESVAAQTLLIPYNDTEALDQVIAEHGQDIALLAVEPIAGNMGVIPPEPGFLQRLRHHADSIGALLLFDEVITGFRFTFGSVDQQVGVYPDVYCFGKIIGGGLPIGAVGARSEIMDHLAPAGSVYQAGTLSGNPLSMAAGGATLGVLQSESPHEGLTQRAEGLARHVRDLARAAGIPLQVPQAGPMFSLFFSPDPVRNFADVQSSDAAAFRRLYRELIHEGLFLPPSPFEACFLSTAHTDSILDQTANAFSKAFRKVFSSAS